MLLYTVSPSISFRKSTTHHGLDVAENGSLHIVSIIVKGTLLSGQNIALPTKTGGDNIVGCGSAPRRLTKTLRRLESVD